MAADDDQAFSRVCSRPLGRSSIPWDAIRRVRDDIAGTEDETLTDEGGHDPTTRWPSFRSTSVLRPLGRFGAERRR